MAYIIAVDLGGTFIRVALFKCGNSRVLRKIVKETKARQGTKAVIQRLCSSIDLILEGIDKNNVKNIVIGVPGAIDCKKGKVFFSSNLLGWKNISLGMIIRKHFGIKTIIENDANCAAIGEARARKVENLVLLTLGTGVGSGIILNNKIYHGSGIAAELGHMTIQQNGLKCRCGNYGCLEEYISVRGIQRIARKLKIITEPKKIEEMARKGNKKAIRVYVEAGKYLGVGLSNIANVLAPDLIVLAGGLSKAGNLLLLPAIKEMRKRALKQASSKVKVEKSILGDNTGLFGASLLANESS